MRRSRNLKAVPGGDELFKGVPPVDPAAVQKESQKQADAAAKNLLDMRNIANDAQKPTIVNVAAPVVNVTVPEQTAPVVNNTVNLPETTVNFEALMPAQDAPVVNIAAPEAPIVNVVNRLPEQPAPVVTVVNEVPVPEVTVILPARKTVGTIERDADGKIIRTEQIETDA